MTKYVRDTKAAGQLRAFAIMKGRREVAKVLAHVTPSRTLVNVWQDHDGAMRTINKHPMLRITQPIGSRYDRAIFQSETASGYGYDKFTAALSGLWIDGHELTDHCERQLVPPKGSAVFPSGYTAPKGYRLANWSEGAAGWQNCYRLPGLEYLRDFGYTVVEVL